MHRLKRVPTRTLGFFRWIYASTIGQPATDNLHYAALRARHESDEVLSLEDINEIIVPLLVERGHDIQRIRLEALILYFIMGVVVAVAVFFGQSFLSQIDKTTRSNQQGIYVGCTVTANVVVRAGAQVSSSNGKPPPLTDQQRLSTLRIEALRRNFTSHERSVERRLVTRIARAGGLQVPNCKQIAMHPEQVKPYTPNALPSRSP